MKKFKLGFTLAEVLITLAIIGVVAAIVMPTVISSYQYKAVGTKIAKFVATTENAARVYVTERDSFRPASDQVSKTENGETTTTYNGANGITSFMNDTYMFTEIGLNTSIANKAYDSSKANLSLLGTEYKKTSQSGDKIVQYSLDGTITTGEGEDAKEDAAGGVGILKDGTAVAAYIPGGQVETAMVKTGLIDPAKTGETAFVLVFDPMIKGLPNIVQHQYRFVVTELGYVFADATDPCTTAISVKNWTTNADLYTKGADASCYLGE